MLKVGDSIEIIKERIGTANDYPCGFVSAMLKYCGITAKIVNVQKCDINYTKCKFYNGDEYKYSIDIDNGAWAWHSSMFRQINKMEKQIIINDASNFLYLENTPVIYIDDQNELHSTIILTIDPPDIRETYKIQYNGGHWISPNRIYPDFEKLFDMAESIIFFSKIF